MTDKSLPEYLLLLCRAAKDKVSCELPEQCYLTSGICSLLSMMDDLEPSSAVSWSQVSRYKTELMARWPESSGCRSYPVSVPWEDLTSVEIEALEDTGVYEEDGDDRTPGALFELVNGGTLYDGNFWYKGSEYGKARWRLLDWMIEALEKELKNEQAIHHAAVIERRTQSAQRAAHCSQPDFLCSECAAKVRRQPDHDSSGVCAD